MSINYEIEVLSQGSIYNKLNKYSENERKLKVYFSLPRGGVSEETGILLLIAGFGAHSNSKVYKKMRDKFADEHNLITIQCDYFGYEFMQESKNIHIPKISKDDLKDIFSTSEIEEIYKGEHFDFEKLIQLGSKYNINLNVEENLSGESRDNFNDMGLMQASDNIVSVLSVLNVIFDNTMIVNTKKVIIYGNSHGSYLGYLCNILAPNLFSLIIDNSAWLYPVYLYEADRCVPKKFDNLILTSRFNYLARKIIADPKILDLRFLYSKHNNNCMIVSYHGSDDNLITASNKKSFCEGIDKAIYNEITADKVDGLVFKSTRHGLDADFIELFQYTFDRFNIKFEHDTFIDLPKSVIVETDSHQYIVDYENIMPRIRIN